MHKEILIADLKDKIAAAEERIEYYLKELENNPGDKMFEASLHRCRENKNAYEWELAKQLQSEF